MLCVKIALVPGGMEPCRMTPHAVGFDLFARLDEPLILQPRKRAAIPVGFTIEIPEGYEAQIRPRSGLALNKGLALLNSPGTIDPDYRGEVKVIVANLGEEEIEISNGDRIAQMVIVPVADAKLCIVAELSKSQRGQGGFGSTGK